MILFYVDEAGSPDSHDVPLLEGQTPLFILSAVALRGSSWRDLDRGLLGLKKTYFLPEMKAFEAADPIRRRYEHFEIKGKELLRPGNARSRRRMVFVRKVFNLADGFGARLFAAIWRKSANAPTDSVSMYTHSFQILSERFQHYCEELNELGIIVADSRTHGLDFTVAAGHLSFIFGHPEGRQYTRLIEAPMFADSVLSAGVQLADMLGSCLYGYYYQRKCSDVSGLFHAANNAVTPKQLAANPGGPWKQVLPARDYSHCAAFWPWLDKLQFRRAGVSPPRPGFPVSGYYGFREVT